MLFINLPGLLFFQVTVKGTELTDAESGRRCGAEVNYVRWVTYLNFSVEKIKTVSYFCMINQ